MAPFLGKEAAWYAAARAVLVLLPRSVYVQLGGGTMTSRIPWYSIGRDLKPVDHEPVDLPEAVALVDRYFGQLRSTYASGEEALAATVFGFARAKNDFLEVCLNGVADISVRVESPRQAGGGFIAKLRGTLKHEETLTGRESVVRRVEQYFVLSAAEFQAKLAETTP
jgi:hypothetical protein